jgi:hypothetical protein
MTTTRLDRVMLNQRRLFFFNLATVAAFVSTVGASLAAML